MATAGIHVVWFKRDLRVHDHAPLTLAAEAGWVLPVFAIEPGQWQAPDSALRHWQFAADSLVDLQAALGARGLPLCIWEGDVLALLASLKAHYGALTLYSHEETGNAWSYARDVAVGEWCRAEGVTWHEHRQVGVVRGLKSRVDQTAWEEQWEALMQAPPFKAPASARPAPGWEAFHHRPVEELPTLTLGVDTTPCPERQFGGRRAGRALWYGFITQRGERYRGSISKPLRAEVHGSRLSPHLAWGTLSMREVVRSLRHQREKHAEKTRWAHSLRSLASRLHWHCHFIQKLESEPSIEDKTLHPALKGLRERDPQHPRLLAWKCGQTGVPLVDACMRCLIHTGWINFRMRAMLISFATFGLGLHWREPGLHLARLFTDFEPGIHYPQIQMQSGATGFNTLRIYNPIKQAEDNDPSGEFVARWVPELNVLPVEWRAKPWALPESLQTRYAFTPGEHYPIPFEFEAEAQKWKTRIFEMSHTPEAKAISQTLMARLASHRRPSARRGRAKPVDHRQLALFEQASASANEGASPNDETPL
ncbi:FAD-binding domain-containing protein [Halomonas sp. PAMB 3264]|uniref:cryptochrome/deoxyribodipyrimidine photo-lyase family protein n=1 Tax=Halomonas sp. PAMB 3264 TaxID=3075222 RepID=UPI002899ED0A|nr:FAD-binding domain-containing protein [Halomonas sp. PAMB 3264]WNL41969.1 FAD-binding domain-containing protein [Halomonas sp. PAMB 3264]